MLYKKNLPLKSLATHPSFSRLITLNIESLNNILRLEKKGWVANDLRGKFFLYNNQPLKVVSQFHLNNPVFYKAKNIKTIKVYEFPCFESLSQSLDFKKGNVIEEKWGVGLYDKYKPIKDKSWIAAVCGNKFIGWLLLSDVEANFEKRDD